MKSIFNKRKINYLSNKKIISSLSILLLIVISLFIYYDLKNNNKLEKLIQVLSSKFDYELKFYEINNLSKVNKLEVVKILNKYLDKSIFLIPLTKVSKSLNNLTWVDNVSLSTDLKNTIKVAIKEYEPIGLYLYNNQLYYFAENGKIIAEYDEDLENNNFIIFHGKKSILNASNIIKILNKIKFNNYSKIISAFYINERRWNIMLNNEILLYLSEKNTEESLKNYVEIIGKLKNSEISSIKSIDLRNNEKAIIRFK